LTATLDPCLNRVFPNHSSFVIRQLHRFVLGRVFEMIGDAVFEEKAGWRGATKENTPGGSATEEATKPGGLFLKNPPPHPKHFENTP
jgi:hypothetical protein